MKRKILPRYKQLLKYRTRDGGSFDNFLDSKAVERYEIIDQIPRAEPMNIDVEQAPLEELPQDIPAAMAEETRPKFSEFCVERGPHLVRVYQTSRLKYPFMATMILASLPFDLSNLTINPYTEEFFLHNLAIIHHFVRSSCCLRLAVFLAFIIYRVGQKKWIFVIFWDPKMYCSKNDPSRGNFMRGIDCSHSRTLKMFL
jgi:hypothetical protein